MEGLIALLSLLLSAVVFFTSGALDPLIIYSFSVLLVFVIVGVIFFKKTWMKWCLLVLFFPVGLIVNTYLIEEGKKSKEELNKKITNYVSHLEELKHIKNSYLENNKTSEQKLKSLQKQVEIFSSYSKKSYILGELRKLRHEGNISVYNFLYDKERDPVKVDCSRESILKSFFHFQKIQAHMLAYLSPIILEESLLKYLKDKKLLKRIKEKGKAAIDSSIELGKHYEELLLKNQKGFSNKICLNLVKLKNSFGNFHSKFLGEITTLSPDDFY